MKEQKTTEYIVGYFVLVDAFDADDAAHQALDIIIDMAPTYRPLDLIVARKASTSIDSFGGEIVTIESVGTKELLADTDSTPAEHDEDGYYWNLEH